jgi:hypothetical protein
MPVKKVEKKVKIGVALAIAFIAFGAYLLVPAALAEEEYSEPETTVKHRLRRLPIKLRLLIHVLRNGTPTELGGQVVAIEGRILVVSYGDGLLNVNVPGKWIVGGETYTVDDLFDGDPFGLGDLVSIKSLKIEMVRETHSVTLYLAYSLTVEDATASAVLPFNIEA